MASLMAEDSLTGTGQKRPESRRLKILTELAALSKPRAGSRCAMIQPGIADPATRSAALGGLILFPAVRTWPRAYLLTTPLDVATLDRLVRSLRTGSRLRLG